MDASAAAPLTTPDISAACTYETASAQQGGHRAALGHQSARLVAAHQLQGGPLLQRLLERQLHHVLDRLERVAAAGRALDRKLRPQPAATAAALPRPAE
jgi:hypothetical protein